MFNFLSIRSDEDYINSILHEDAVSKITDERFIELEKQQVLESGRIYLYIMGRTVQPCFLATESAVRIEDEKDGEEHENDESKE